MPRSLATCSTLLSPARTSATASARNSGGYPLGPGMWTSFAGYHLPAFRCPPNRVNSSPPNRVNSKADVWVNLAPTASVTKHTGTTQKYSAAFSAFGFSAGASSKYSSQLELTYAMGTAYGNDMYHLWGRDGVPMDNATDLDAYAGPDTAGPTPTS